MGVRGLLTYCKPICTPVKDIQAIGPYRIGIDAYSLLFIFREYRDDFTRYIQRLLAAGHTLTIVMDKRAMKEKKDVVEARKEIRDEATSVVESLTSFRTTEEYNELDEKQRAILQKHIDMKKHDSWCLYKEYVCWFKGMVTGLGAQILQAPEEADTVLAKDAKDGKYDVIISNDTDLLILGVGRLWLPSKSRDGSHSEILGTTFLQFLGFEGEQVFELAFLAGCDVQPTIIMPIKEAIGCLRFYKSLATIHSRRPALITDAHMETYKNLRKNVWVV